MGRKKLLLLSDHRCLRLGFTNIELSPAHSNLIMSAYRHLAGLIRQ